MQRWPKIAAWTAGIIVAVPVLLVGGVLVFANTGAGQRLIARQAGALSGGMVTLSGLGGRFPDALRVQHIEVNDRKGAWLTASGVVLDWSPLALFGGTARIDALTAAQIAVPRLPLPSTTPTKSSGGFKLPVSVDVGRLAIARLDIGAPVAGAAAALKIDGTAHVVSLQQGSATLDAARLDSPGTYRVQGSLSPASINASITAREPPGGLIATLAKVPALGALDVQAKVDGPQTAERAHLTASAGPLRLALDGTADLPGKTASVDVKATAQAMHPRPDIAWQGIDITGHAAGRFTAPDATAHVAIQGLAAAGASVATITADVRGTRGHVGLHGVLTGTHLPGAQANLLAAAPIDITGGIDLQAPHRPAQFRISHPLLTVSGDAQTAGGITADVTAAVPDLAPIAASAGSDVKGRLDLTAHAAQHGGATDLAAAGTADITGGRAPLPSLLGPAKFAAAATLDGADITVRNLTLDGRAIKLDLTGADQKNALDFSWTVGLPDLAALNPQARGAVTAKGHIGGAIGAISATAEVTGEAGSGQFAKAPVNISARADHLPSAPSADVDASLQLSGAPLTLRAQARTDAAGTLHTVLQRADWKSFTAAADLSLPKGADVPTGKLNLSVGRLADFAQFAGADLAGSLKAALLSAPDNATVQVTGSNLASGPRRIASLTLNGRAEGAINDPDLTATLNLDGISAQGITGQSRVALRGRANALTIGATAALQNLQGANANLSLAALLNARAKQLTLHSLTGDWKTLALRQQGPALVDFGEKIAVDRLHLTINQASLDVAGRVSPTLDLTAALHNVTPDLARPLAPSLEAAGTLSATARLTGTPAALQGQVRLNATGLRLKTGPAASLPPAAIRADARLNGQTAHVDMHVNAGPRLALAVTGTAPLQPAGPLALQATGRFDLALLAPVLQAQGRNASGHATLDIAASGTPRTPRIDGSITLANAELQDFAQGLLLTHIGARIDASGDTLTITRFNATAGPGDIALSGTVGALAPGLPVDLHITAHNARPLASDLLTAWFDADLTVRGQAAAQLNASGKILLHKVEINIPDSLPTSVAVLNVRRPGQHPPAPPAANAPPPASVQLGIDVDSPGEMFVRGKGLDAELGGRLHISGTSAAPLIEGGFHLRRGDFSLAGTTLTFTKGTVGFNGASSLGKIDPSLDFEADSTANSITASLFITGYADMPKITLSSVPPLPQDEVLAHLLFGTGMKNLSPFQIAEIGAALAELSGMTGGGGPLGSIRKGLGLDRLSVGGGGNGAGPSVEAGKYVAKGVYVGAKQSTGGAGGTQALVQVDLTRHLKLNATLGTGGGNTQGATPQNDPGTSVGLSYQFDY
jgi:translocation and assembly module TamB